MLLVLTALLILTSTSQFCCDQSLVELEHTFIFTLDTLYTLYTLYCTTSLQGSSINLKKKQLLIS